MTWDTRWMDMAQLVTGWSKDQSRGIGAAVVDSRNVLVAVGWNGFPRGIDDDVPCRHERPVKYQWTEHAERNAIFNAAAKGISTSGCRIYVTWYPCADCARAIVQAGIAELIGVEPDWTDPRWGDDFAMVREMLAEAGVSSRFLKGYRPPTEGNRTVPPPEAEIEVMARAMWEASPHHPNWTWDDCHPQFDHAPWLRLAEVAHAALNHGQREARDG